MDQISGGETGVGVVVGGGGVGGAGWRRAVRGDRRWDKGVAAEAGGAAGWIGRLRAHEIFSGCKMDRIMRC